MLQVLAFLLAAYLAVFIKLTVKPDTEQNRARGMHALGRWRGNSVQLAIVKFLLFLASLRQTTPSDPSVQQPQ